MDGFWDSLSKWFSEKTGTPLYFTYIGFLAAWNWKIIYVLTLEDASKLPLPAIEYIQRKMLFSLESILHGTWPWVITVVNWVANTAWHIVPPAALTLLAILYMPRLQKWALGKYLDSRFDRKKIYQTKQREYNDWVLNSEKETEETLEKIATVKKRQVQQKVEISKATSKEDRWSQEFDLFKSNRIYPKFTQIIDAVYTNSGLIGKWDTSSRYNKIIESDTLALAHATDLITIEGTGYEEKIALTEKGRFFVAQYMSQTNIEENPFI